MPSYHSSIKSDKSIGNIAMLSFKTKFRGPINALNPNDVGDDGDIIDEAIAFFKANVFFKSFEIQNNADRLTVYLTLYISECLKTLIKCTNGDALSQMHQLAISRFDIPGDPKFPLNSVYQRPKSAEETELMRQYLTQLREECGVRVSKKVFDTDDGRPSKWWTCFAKRKFMDINLSA